MDAPAAKVDVSAEVVLANTACNVPAAETVRVPQRRTMPYPPVPARVGEVHMASDRVVLVTRADVPASAVVVAELIRLAMLIADSVRPDAENPNVVVEAMVPVGSQGSWTSR